VGRLPGAYRPEALSDLVEIFRYILGANQNHVIAEGFVRPIKASCERIGDAPNGGRPGDDLEPGLRTMPFERSAVIAYKVGMIG
jgi:toxin ParE1/3/4